MKRDALVGELGKVMPTTLAEDLVDDLIKIRHDVATDTLERAAPGKFVESVVQALQFMERGSYDTKPSVDAYLKGLESRSSSLDDGLRICAARVGRAMYTLRNKRNILHKGDVDPNRYDLRFLLSSAQWIMAELLRVASGYSMEKAGELIAQVQTPPGALIEDVDGKTLVLADLPVEEEILVVLQAHYPASLPVNRLTHHMDRWSAGHVRGKIRELWADRLVEGGGRKGYRLTRLGLEHVKEVLIQEAES